MTTEATDKKTTYRDKLCDLRWQAKRAQVLERDHSTCRQCGKSKTDDPATILNVHHIKYRGGLDPWEYNDDELTTLCESCHIFWHQVHPLAIKDHSAIINTNIFDQFARIMQEANYWNAKKAFRLVGAA